MHREGEAAEPRTACQGSLIALPSASDLQLKLQRLPPGCSVAAPPSRIIAPGRTQMKSGVHCLQRGTRKEQAGPPRPAGRALSVFCQGREPASKAEKMGSGGGGKQKLELKHPCTSTTMGPGPQAQAPSRVRRVSTSPVMAKQGSNPATPYPGPPSPVSHVQAFPMSEHLPCLSISHVRTSPLSEPACLPPVPLSGCSWLGTWRAPRALPAAPGAHNAAPAAPASSITVAASWQVLGCAGRF